MIAKKIGVAAVFILATVVFFGCAAPKKAAAPEEAAEPEKIVEPEKPKPQAIVVEGFDSPESVAVNADSTRFFVSNLGVELKPFDRDGDGYISELTPEGAIVNKRFLPGEGEKLNAPKGILVLGNVLYVTDIDRLVGFDINTRKKVMELSLFKENIKFLNDPVAVSDETLLVSATDIGAIYKVNLKGKPSYKVLLKDLVGVNGLYYDAHSGLIFVANFGDDKTDKGALGLITLNGDTVSYKALTKPIGLLDGVGIIPGEGVVFSDWVEFGKPGKLYTYMPSTGDVGEMTLAVDVKGPADFFFDHKNNCLWLPAMAEGKLIIQTVPQ